MGVIVMVCNDFNFSRAVPLPTGEVRGRSFSSTWCPTGVAVPLLFFEFCRFCFFGGWQRRYFWVHGSHVVHYFRGQYFHVAICHSGGVHFCYTRVLRDAKGPGDGVCLKEGAFANLSSLVTLFLPTGFDCESTTSR